MKAEWLVSELRRVAEHLRPNPNTWRVGVEVNNIELLADLLTNAADEIDRLRGIETSECPYPHWNSMSEAEKDEAIRKAGL